MQIMTRNIPKIEVDLDSINDQEIAAAFDNLHRTPSPPNRPEKLSVKQATTYFAKQAISPLIARSVSFAVVDPRSMAGGGGGSLSIPGTPEFLGKSRRLTEAVTVVCGIDTTQR